MKSKVSALLMRWPLFLVGIVGTSAVVCAGVSIKCNPTFEESIYVFAPSYSFDVSKFVSDSLEITDGIRQITVKHSDPNSEEATKTFASYYSICDFYIMPESWVSKITPIALSFTEESLHSLIPNSSSYELYKDGDKNLGIKIYDKETDAGAGKNYITYTKESETKEDYYLLFREDSLHLNGLNNSKTDNALRIVNNLLKV